jgi:hypothetical protein
MVVDSTGVTAFIAACWEELTPGMATGCPYFTQMGRFSCVPPHLHAQPIPKSSEVIDKKYDYFSDVPMRDLKPVATSLP